MTKVDISNLVTETRNPKTMNLDDMTVGEILKTMNEEDTLVPLRVREVLPQVEIAVTKIIEALKLVEDFSILVVERVGVWEF